MWETIKQHKLLIGGIVAAVFVFVLVFGTSSSADSTVGDPTTDTTDPSVAANLALAQLQASTQNAGIAASQDVTNQQTAASVTENSTNADVTNNANTLAAQVAEFETSIAGDVQKNSDTLSAQTAQNAQNQQTAQTSLLTGALVSQTAIQAGVAENASNNQTATFSAYIQALPTLIGEQTAPALAQAQKQCTSVLFGLFSSC